MFGKIFADELADDLRWREILLRAQRLERFLLVWINQQSEAGGFRFHRSIVSYNVTDMLMLLTYPILVGAASLDPARRSRTECPISCGPGAKQSTNYRHAQC